MKKILKFFGIIIIIGIIGGAITGTGDLDSKDIKSEKGDGSNSVTIEEQILLDKKDIVITATNTNAIIIILDTFMFSYPFSY